MSRKRHKEEGHPNHERWLVSYADFITVLMIFFIVMFSMSQVNATKYKQLAASLNDALGGGKSIIGSDKPPLTNENVAPIPEVKQMEEAKKEVEEYLKNEGLTGKVKVSIDDRGLVISLQDTLIFDSGSAIVKPTHRQTLAKIGIALKKMPNFIRVEGHTDNIPIKNSQFSSNWQLSAVRAANIVEVIINDSKISPNIISALGYGENRPVAPNSSSTERAKNRRVDIVLLKSKYNETEKNSSTKANSNVKK
ncbi:flagellar motor protein MotB [Clostridium cylindrosporum]|uniref:Motility protein B n=1 Tax=Clostridium cylindrosporum DSM 605 TaxID=1121307 RepID=A0A0J8DGP5_CLOCY|nr:flagellar motor protein MotB [Clostridium cylindrosporum]KMT23363.1 motility protein B [Clostridium cylindrosporum DSM 605]